MDKITEIEPVFVEFIPRELENGRLYISEEYCTASHLCCCGCGERTVTPLYKGQWELFKSNGTVTLRPSIGNFQIPCKSHYNIIENKVLFV